MQLSTATENITGKYDKLAKTYARYVHMHVHCTCMMGKVTWGVSEITKTNFIYHGLH